MTANSVENNPGTAQRFEVLAELNRGRMGVVYRMVDHFLGREVAYKVPKQWSTGESEVTRQFIKEAQITAQLQHPGIPPVHDVGILADGCPFITMKLIMGNTLETVLKEEPDRTAERGRLVTVFEQVCQTVAYAHFCGIVHRDLEPANIMIGRFGEVQVLDWGLAVFIPQEGASTVLVDDAKLGANFGNPVYMAPEQARGEPADFRTDVFGLGGLLCHILTGVPPFWGKSAATMAKKAADAELGHAADRLDQCKTNMNLVELAKHCLRPNLVDRPLNAGEVASLVAASRK